MSIKDVTSRQVQILINGNYTTQIFIIITIKYNTSIHLSITGATSMQNQTLNTGIYHGQWCIIQTIKHNIIIHLSIKDAMSYSIFSKCIYIKFSIKVWLLILNATTITIVDLLHITINCMILHICHTLLFHKTYQRNIGQTFHISNWLQQVHICQNVLYCSHRRLCIEQHDYLFLPSLGAAQTASTI